MNLFLSILTAYVELFIASHFFDSLFDIKQKKHVKSLTGFLIFSIYLLILIFVNSPIFNTISYCLAIYLFSTLCYTCSIKSSILSSIFIVAVSMGTEFLTMGLLSFAYEGNINAYSINNTTHAISLVFSKMFLLIITKLSSSLGLRFSKEKTMRTPPFLFLFPMCSMVILYTFWIIASNYQLSNQIQLIVSISSVVLILAVVLTYIFYGKTTKELDELYSKQRDADRVENDIAYYSLLDKQNNLLKTFAHDEKNHLSAIKSIAQNEEVDRYIDKVYGEIKQYSTIGNTNNKMLDLTINKYHHICADENIIFNVSVKTANLPYIEDTDLITMLNNLLDNAIEAAKKSVQKTIDLSINKTNGFDFLVISNSCDTRPISVGKKLKTSKTNEYFHGLGINSVKKIVAKYDGDFDWKFDESSREFIVYIAFNIF